MNIIERAISILTTPKPTWQKIAAEPNDPQSIYVPYAVVLALLPAIGTIIGGVVFGGAGAFPFVYAVLAYLLQLGLLFVAAIILGAVLPGMGVKADTGRALKLLVYSSTPNWVAGLVSWIPIIGWLIAIAAWVYSIILIYWGSEFVMDAPEDKRILVTLITFAVLFVLGLVVGLIVTTLAVAIGFGAAVTGGVFS